MFCLDPDVFLKMAFEKGLSESHFPIDTFEQSAKEQIREKRRIKQVNSEQVLFLLWAKSISSHWNARGAALWKRLLGKCPLRHNTVLLYVILSSDLVIIAPIQQ